MVYYEPVKVIINVLSLVEVITKAILRHHDLLDLIVSDCGSVFTFNFWSSLYYFFKIKQKLLRAFYPQTNG